MGQAETGCSHGEITWGVLVLTSSRDASIDGPSWRLSSNERDNACVPGERLHSIDLAAKGKRVKRDKENSVICGGVVSAQARQPS